MTFEVFELDTHVHEVHCRDDNHDVCEFDTQAFPGGVVDLQGWYWWACFPGCLPDGEASGPFATEEAATADALELRGTQ
jgi:hypothetical protein